LETKTQTHSKWKQLIEINRESLFNTSVTSIPQIEDLHRSIGVCENGCCRKVVEELEALKREVEKIRRFLAIPKGALVS